MRVAAFVGALALAATACSDRDSGDALPSPPAGLIDAVVPQDRGVLVGAWVKPDRGQSRLEALTEYEQAIRRRLDIVHAFYPWESPFPTELERAALARGSTPMISWNGTDTTRIVAGDHDSLIDERARAVKALGKPVFMRWFWEPEQKGKAANVRSPEDYIAAWKYVRGKFLKAGATNALWTWCPTAFGFARGTAPPYYPGDDQVDWLCADGYSGDTGGHGGRRRQFENIFRAWYDWATPHNKPLMVGETGVNGTPEEQAQWLRQVAERLEREFPNIRAVVYFDSPSQGDWTLRRSPTTLEALAEIARRPYFNMRRLPAAQ